MTMAKHQLQVAHSLIQAFMSVERGGAQQPPFLCLGIRFGRIYKYLMSRESSFTRAFESQAIACDFMGSPFTASLCRHIAKDYEARGICYDLMQGWPEKKYLIDALPMRICGGIHYASITKRDEALHAAYPDNNEDWRIEEIWPLAEAYLKNDFKFVQGFLKSPPQTNEVRRSNALMAGLLWLCNKWKGVPIHALELGASAGLLQHLDKFQYQNEAWSYNGGGDVQMDTEWRGAIPPLQHKVQIESRAACDQNPLNIQDQGARNKLKAFIWADQKDRIKRFEAATALALQEGVKLDKQDAAKWLKEQLQQRPKDQPCVVYHSIFYQYPDTATREAIRGAIIEAGYSANEANPLAWLRFEGAFVFDKKGDPKKTLLDVVTWPSNSQKGDRTRLADVCPHGQWVEWLDKPAGDV